MLNECFEVSSFVQMGNKSLKTPIDFTRIIFGDKIRLT
jgi:hypothetical protein